MGRRHRLVKVHFQYSRCGMVFILKFFNVEYACVGAILDLG